MLCIAAPGFAQVYNTVNSASKNAINSKESLADIEGDPYLSKDYQKAFVRFANSVTSLYEIKYDQMADEIVVKGENGQELAFSETVLEFKFQDSKRIFRNGFSPEGKSTERSFYEVLFDGKVKYLKKNHKSIIEAKGYNTMTKKILEETKYYVVSPDGKLQVVRNNEKSILAAVGQPKLADYAKENKLNFKNDADVAKLLAYNDSL